MRFKFLTMLTVVSVGMFALDNPAYSIPLPKESPVQKKRADIKIKRVAVKPDVKASQKASVKPNLKKPNAKQDKIKHSSEQRPAVAAKITARAMIFHVHDEDLPPPRALAPVTPIPARTTFGTSVLITEARKYLGTNPTAMSRRWCARFMNLVLTKAGYAGTGSDAARSFASYGRRVSEPRVGAIAVLSRGRNRNLGHVGIVTGIDPHGNPIIISGNHGHRVGEGTYPRNRVIAYVMPASQPQLARGPSSSASDAGGEGIASPITELLAAINAESPREERRTAQTPLSLQQVPVRVAARAPQVPVRVAVQAPQAPPERVRVVEQMAPSGANAYAAQPSRVSVNERGRLPLDPALARLFGVKR
jgi:uncharacterized protein (TIGR02594 family)